MTTTGFVKIAGRGSKMLSPKNNAQIALERFRVQSYNWDKTTAELQKIYGVGTKFIAKMREDIGVPAPKDRLKINNDKAMALFKCHPEHHGLSYREIKKLYDVTETWAKKMIRECSETSYKKRLEALDALVYDDPDFGTPGECASMSQKDFANKLGVSEHIVGSRRRLKGVLPYKIHKDWLSEPEKRIYKLCKLTRTWGRPAGIDRYLEQL